MCINLVAQDEQRVVDKSPTPAELHTQQVDSVKVGKC